MATPSAAAPAANADRTSGDKQKPRVKIQVETENEMDMETEGGGASTMRRRAAGSENAPRWWEAPCIGYAREDMQRAASTASEGSFWTTIELLARCGRRGSGSPRRDREPGPAPPAAAASSAPAARPRTAASFTHPHVRARLEKHMGSNAVRLTDKYYMQELQRRIVRVTEEALNKRIAARELDEMERLKRLILCGKTPLAECPPELRAHPVFVFWRLVDREVARASKKRADAYYRKLKAFRNVEQLDEEHHSGGDGLSDEADAQLTPEELLQQCAAELEQRRAEDVAAGLRFADDQYARLKYEAEDVKRLKALTTVEELYKLADQIIGVPRTL